jgi:AraC family transcriptional regulator, transcriptional activator of pobA
MKNVFGSLITKSRQEAGHAYPVKNSFRICELHKLLPGDAPERLEYFEILYVKRGIGTLTVDAQQYALADNTVYCLAQGQYRVVTLEEGAEGYCISLSQEFLYFADCDNHYGMSEIIMMADAELDNLIGLMYVECVKQDRASLEILRNLLKAFIMIGMRSIGPRTDVLQAHLLSDERIITRFFTLLRQHFTTRKLVAEYADDLCITPNYLNAVVKRQTGFPASHHIQQVIIMEAKRHAIYSDLRMKEIADLLGFDDCAHFSKFFKSFSGTNFSSFKRSLA